MESRKAIVTKFRAGKYSNHANLHGDLMQYHMKKSQEAQENGHSVTAFLHDLAVTYESFARVINSLTARCFEQEYAKMRQR